MWVVFVVDLGFFFFCEGVGVVSLYDLCVFCFCLVLVFLKKIKLADTRLSQLCVLVMLKAKVLAASARM